ncbi:hypothetical protein O0L34_g16591 [Tuta absoluta]|nr:hypothetical protein O0L34_g14711 [Tuta absoluta]KAJ2943025.1 hypothetical protein O0L34_g15218 [Tuta absoluta]KAJ2943484.1 hypothetical protein O0L34_g16591 [Tuta absoluta]
MSKTDLIAMERLINKCIAPFALEIARLTNIIEALEVKFNSSSVDTRVSQIRKSLTNKPITNTGLVTSVQKQPTGTADGATSSATSSANEPVSARAKRAAARKGSNNTNPCNNELLKTPPHAQKQLQNADAPRKFAHNTTVNITAPPINLNISKITPHSSNTASTMSGTDTQDKQQDDQDSWTEVNNKRKRRPGRTVLHGAGNADVDLQTVEKLRHIQAWSFKPETTTENILTFLNKITQCNDYTVLKRDIGSARHACFVIGMPESLYALINTPSVWPPGVRLSDWFLQRSRAAREQQDRSK